MNYSELFDTLASDNSRNFKIKTLSMYKNDEVLRRAVFLALDPMTQFYIRKIPTYAKSASPAGSLSWGLTELEKLSTRVYTGNAGVAHLKNILESLEEYDARVIERIIGKDLKCGVSDSTANAVWPGLIADFPCMLCSQFSQKLIDKIRFPAYVQCKMDGMRMVAIVADGVVRVCSRSGREIDLHGSLDQEFLKMADGHNIVFDGELLVGLNGVLNRQTGNGILNRAVKGTISKEDADTVVATIWDVIPYDDFMKGVYKVPYHKRFAILECMSLPKRISLAEDDVVDSFEEANAIFEKYLASGEEGIILKDMNSIWENKRSKSQIKLKGVYDTSLKVVGVQEGTGKYAGMVGALLCESADGVVKVGVGTGLNDDARRVTDYLGKIVDVKYNARIRNKQGEESLFLPVFKTVRFDKSEADNSCDIV